eukprot:scaffold21922_cov32-Tisochrysis_lutea.AAC.3
MFGLLEVARAAARAHLVSLGCCSRSLRWHGIGRGVAARSAGAAGVRVRGDGRGGGERRALHDP